MTSRDDMVFRPSIGRRLQGASAPVRAREERALEDRRRRRGLARRIAIARAARSRSRRKQRQAAAKRARFDIPLSGLAIGVGLAAGLIATRIVTGQPLEKTGQDVRNIIYGDLDVDSMAARDARMQLSGNRDVLRIIGQEGKVNAQIGSVAEDLKKLAKIRRLGEKRIREAFPVDSILDMLILRLVSFVKQSFKSSGGEKSIQKLKMNFQRVAENASARGR